MASIVRCTSSTPPHAAETDDASVETASWITFSIDGQRVPIDRRGDRYQDEKDFTTLEDEAGRHVQSEKLLEIVFANDKAVRVESVCHGRKTVAKKASRAADQVFPFADFNFQAAASHFIFLRPSSFLFIFELYSLLLRLVLFQRVQSCVGTKFLLALIVPLLNISNKQRNT